MTGRPPGRPASSASPPADYPLFYELAHRIRCAFLIRVNLSSVLEFFLISGWGAWRDVAKRRRAGNQVETFGTQPETGTRFFYLDSLQLIEKPRIGERNPRKSKDFSLDLFGFSWFYLHGFPLEVVSALRDRFRRRGTSSVQSIGAGLPPS